MDTAEMIGRWPARFDDRMQKQIDFSREYAQKFGHGAPGHLDMIVIARLAMCLEDAIGMIESVQKTLHTEPTDVRDLLAAYAHDAWSGWMEYLFEKCSTSIDADGGVIIPGELVKRWRRQMTTAYSALPDHEQDSDRKEADKMLAIVKEAIRAAG
jgi:hypothetical protein